MKNYFLISIFFTQHFCNSFNLQLHCLSKTSLVYISKWPNWETPILITTLRLIDGVFKIVLTLWDAVNKIDCNEESRTNAVLMSGYECYYKDDYRVHWK